MGGPTKEDSPSPVYSTPFATSETSHPIPVLTDTDKDDSPSQCQGLVILELG